jgi:hypothetical protein
MHVSQETAEDTFPQPEVSRSFYEPQPTSAEPSMSLQAVVALVRATATEICGSELEEGAHFADHHFDSLSAVELSNSIGKAVGLTLPSRNSIFAFPSSNLFAKFIPLFDCGCQVVQMRCYCSFGIFSSISIFRLRLPSRPNAMLLIFRMVFFIFTLRLRLYNRERLILGI